MKNNNDIYRITLTARAFDNNNVSIYLRDDRTGSETWLSIERRHRIHGRDRCDILDLFPLSIAQVLEHRVLNNCEVRKSSRRTEFLYSRLPQLLRYAEDEYGYCFFDRTQAKRQEDRIRLDKERKLAARGQENVKAGSRDETDEEEELMYA